jgi:hypothetical protein
VELGADVSAVPGELPAGVPEAAAGEEPVGEAVAGDALEAGVPLESVSVSPFRVP